MFNTVTPTPVFNFVSNINGEPRASTLVIAEAIHLKHKQVMANVDKFANEFKELGSFAFQTRMGNHGGVPVRYAELNEPQATFLISLSRNTPKVVEFKLKLVKEFYTMRELLKAQEEQKAQTMQLPAPVVQPMPEIQEDIPKSLSYDEIFERVAEMANLNTHNVFVLNDAVRRAKAQGWGAGRASTKEEINRLLTELNGLRSEHMKTVGQLAILSSRTSLN